MTKNWSLLPSLFLFTACAAAQSATPPAPLPPVLAQIDKIVREDFFDPKLKGVDWSAAVRRAAEELARAETVAAKNAAYDRLLATLDDSHTFRLPAGKPLGHAAH